MNRRRLLPKILGIIFLYIFYGCTGFPEHTAEEKVQPDENTVNTTKKEELPPLETLLLPVIQLNEFMMSADSYEYFTQSGDPTFISHLYALCSMEGPSYLQGTGTVLTGYNNDGTAFFILKKAMVDKLSDGSLWWQIDMRVNDVHIFYEVLTDKAKNPRSLRFIDRDTDEKYEYSVPSNLSADTNTASNLFFYLFKAPEIIGKENISTGAGTFTSIHVKDIRSETEIADYWLSADVPGGIVKIIYSQTESAANNTFLLEKITNSNKRRTEGENVIPFEIY